MNLTLTLLLIPALALLLTAVLTPGVRGAAMAAGRVATVRPDRWHRKPTPAIGGVAIFVGFGAAILLGNLISPEISGVLRTERGDLLPLSHWEALLGTGCLLFLLGLADDLAELRPATKLAGQLLGASVLVSSGIGIWLTGVYAVDVALSLLWFVGVTNALNFLDNMDGLAAGTGVIAAGVLAALFLMNGEIGLASLALALAGATLGFLAHNYPPARIFMGDSGSLFLGIFLAGLALAPVPGLSRSLFAVVVVPAMILSVPILDTTFVTVSRLLEGRSVAEGGKDHTSHGLVALGMTEKRAVWTLWILALVGGIVGLTLRTADRMVAAGVGGVLLVGLALVGTYLLSARARRDDEEEGPKEAAVEEEELAGATDFYDRILAFHERVPFLTFAMDVVLVGLAYYGAYLIRWDPGELASELEYFRSTAAVVIAAKLLVFGWVGVYGARWRHFGMEDASRMVRANLFGTILVAALLLVFARLGLSRGVLIVDFFLCSVMTVGARFSFRIFEEATRRFAGEGVPVVLVGPPEDAELMVREVRRLDRSSLRPVAVADVNYGPSRGRFRGYPLFGGRRALKEAVRETGAHSVVVVRRREGGDWRLPYTVRDHLKRSGALDVYLLDVRLERWSGARDPAGHAAAAKETAVRDGEIGR